MGSGTGLLPWRKCSWVLVQVGVVPLGVLVGDGTILLYIHRSEVAY